MPAYSKFHADWQDFPSTATPITAAALEHIEQGIFDAVPKPDTLVSGGAVVWNGSGWESNGVSLLRGSDILLNGSFGIWQRGAGPYTADLAYTADAWQIVKGTGAPTVQVDQETTNVTPIASARSMKVTYTHGTGESKIRNRMIDYTQSRGKVATFRVWVKASVATAIRAGLTDGVGTTYSSYHTGGGGWEHLVVSRTMDNAASEFSVFLSLNAGTGAIFYADTADVFLGAVAATSSYPTYWSADPLEEKQRAERRYQILGINAGFKAVAGGDSHWFPLIYHGEMGGGVPTGSTTLTLVTTGTRTNVASVTYAVGTVGGSGARVQVTSTAAGDTTVFGETAALEWNP